MSMRAPNYFQKSTAQLLLRASRGVSLVELGLIMVLISLALVPVVKMVGGPQSSSGEGSAVRVIAQKSKEAVLANTMLEKVMSGDYTSFDCDASGNPIPTFNPVTDLPIGTTTSNSVRQYNICRSQTTNSELYYQWTVVHLNSANNNSNMPQENRYYQATFNVLASDRQTSLLTMPINFFYNEGTFDQPSENTGVMFAMDVSGSMASSCNGWSCSGGVTGYPYGFSSPFMFYRYKAFPTGVTDWGANAFPSNPDYRVTLDMWNDSELDLVFAKQIRNHGPGALRPGQDPDTSTAYNEAFPYGKMNPANPLFAAWGNGVLGSGECTSASDNRWTNPATGDKNLFYTFLPDARYTDWVRDDLRALCEEKNNQAAWSNTVNTKLSRFEAARTAALSLLLNLEAKPAVASSIEIGFIPWSTDPDTHPNHTAALESARVIHGGLHFETIRNRFLWINRADPDDKDSTLPIPLQGGTNIYKGLEYARQRLLAKNYDRRIIVLLTDGEPNPNSGLNSNRAFGGGGLRDYARNTLGVNAPDDEQISLFSVGLIAADGNLMRDMSNSTPNGQAYIANDIASLEPIFESISYQIQKLALLSTASRYGIEF